MKIITFLSILVLQTCIYLKPKPTDNSEKNWSKKITQNNYEKLTLRLDVFGA